MSTCRVIRRLGVVALVGCLLLVAAVGVSSGSPARPGAATAAVKKFDGLSMEGD
jgi:hypothetical protein